MNHMDRPTVQEQWSEETHIGPPSEQINLLEFFQQVKGTDIEQGSTVRELNDSWISITNSEQQRILDECR
jgi:hypothetical protein